MTAPRDRKRSWIQQQKIKEGEVVHPALPWAVAVVHAEVYKQWTKKSPFFFFFTHMGWKVTLLAPTGSCPQMRYCPSEVSGCELSCMAQVSSHVCTSGDLPRVGGAVGAVQMHQALGKTCDTPKWQRWRVHTPWPHQEWPCELKKDKCHFREGNTGKWRQKSRYYAEKCWDFVIFPA